MSYDIEITVSHGDGYKTKVFEGNMTYNVRAMLVEAGLEDSLWTLNNQECSAISELMANVYHNVRKDQGRSISALESENGWGLHKHLVPWLKTLYIAVRTHPRGIVQVF